MYLTDNTKDFINIPNLQVENWLLKESEKSHRILINLAIEPS